MFTPKFKSAPTALEMEIDRLLLALEKMPVKNSEEYSDTADQLVKLYKLKEVDNNSKTRISADKLAEIAGSLLGVLAVINYERIHVLSTKAIGFVTKVR